MKLKFIKFGYEVKASVNKIMRYRVYVCPCDLEQAYDDVTELNVSSLKVAVREAEELCAFFALNQEIAHQWAVFQVGEGEKLTYMASGKTVPEREIKLVHYRD